MAVLTIPSGLRSQYERMSGNSEAMLEICVSVNVLWPWYSHCIHNLTEDVAFFFLTKSGMYWTERSWGLIPSNRLLAIKCFRVGKLILSAPFWAHKWSNQNLFLLFISFVSMELKCTQCGMLFHNFWGEGETVSIIVLCIFWDMCVQELGDFSFLKLPFFFFLSFFWVSKGLALLEFMFRESQPQ